MQQMKAPPILLQQMVQQQNSESEVKVKNSTLLSFLHQD